MEADDLDVALKLAAEGSKACGSHPLPGAVRAGSPGTRLRRTRRLVSRLQRGLALNRAIAVAELDGPEVALSAVPRPAGVVPAAT
jgi:hypothetical protein